MQNTADEAHESDDVGHAEDLDLAEEGSGDTATQDEKPKLPETYAVR